MDYLHGGDIYTYEGLLDFSVNVNPLGLSEAVAAAVRESAGQIGAYPDSRCRKLRNALAKKLELSPDSLIFGNGAAELIFLAVRAQKPKKALLTIPSFAEYRRALESLDCEILEYPLLEKDNFRLTEAYLQALSDDLDLIFLCSPDNPSGAVISGELLLQILEICEEKQIRMVLDECFLDFLPDADERTLKKKILCTKQLFLLRAFTKIHAMPGVRLGYGITGDEALIEEMERQRQPWSVSIPAQAAGIAALEDEEWLKKTRNFLAVERQWLEKQLREIGITVFAGQANYFLLKSEHDLFQILKARGILIRDCSNYAGLAKGYYRVAVRTRAENEILVQALRDVLA